MIKAIHRYLARIKLTSGILSILINPYYFVKKGIYWGLKKNSRYISGRLLDFGCGNKSYQYLFNVDNYIGIDAYRIGHDHTREPIDVFYNGRDVPFKEKSFDSVLCIEVCEHLFDVDKAFSEINRVLRPGGIILITTPFIWEEHEQPFDFGRYTEFGLKDVLNRHQFEIISFEKCGNFIEVIAQMWNLYWFKKFFRRLAFLRFIFIPILILPTNLLGTILSIVLPRNYDVYLHSVVVAKKSGNPV